ncbi:MAG: hypothetical protein AAGC66_17755 [Leifsonia sp.]
MTFQGEVLSVGELMRRSDTESSAAVADPGVRHTAAGNAAHVAALLHAGDDLAVAWRFGILQTFDDYQSTLRRGGPAAAAAVFADAPETTGARELDAAFAALADHLATADGWEAPSWTADRFRTVPWQWFATTPAMFRDEAASDSPPAFRKRGIFITRRALSRA